MVAFFIQLLYVTSILIYHGCSNKCDASHRSPTPRLAALVLTFTLVRLITLSKVCNLKIRPDNLVLRAYKVFTTEFSSYLKGSQVPIYYVRYDQPTWWLIITSSEFAIRLCADPVGSCSRLVSGVSSTGLALPL